MKNFSVKDVKEKGKYPKNPTTNSETVSVTVNETLHGGSFDLLNGDNPKVPDQNNLYHRGDNVSSYSSAYIRGKIYVDTRTLETCKIQKQNVFNR